MVKGILYLPVPYTVKLIIGLAPIKFNFYYNLQILLYKENTV